jgi:type I restriction enzyme S subunit
MNIPQLRFPEFIDKWNEEKMGEIYSFKVTNSFSRDNLNYEEGTVKNIHYGDIHTKFQTLFDITKETVPFINSDISIDRISEDNYCKEGDLILADASEDLNDVGKSIEIFNLNNEKLLAGLHTILARPNLEKLDIGFGGYLFKSNKVRTKIQKEAQGSKVLSISTTRLTNIFLDFPSKEEQKKIVECFSSIDEKIQALKKKHSLLEQYKKGIMQKLFSQELRFKDENGEEFPDWEEKKIGDLGEIITGSTPPTSNREFYNGSYLFVSPVDISNGRFITKTKTTLTKQGFFKGRKIRNGSTLFVCIGSTIGKIAQTTVDCISNQQINAVVPIHNNDDFIYSLLQYHSKFIKELAATQAVPIINKTTFSEYILDIPSLKEQVKIAEYLKLLDLKAEAIETQIEQTDSWKNGLLQKMFC